jgi:hypothetical protein
MAKLRKVNLSSLTPAQRAFWTGMKRAPNLSPDDFVMRIPAKWKASKTWHLRSHGGKGWPDESIKTLANNAALWLVDHWPNRAAQVGPIQFRIDRYQEILRGQFESDYWEPCPLATESTRIGVPTCDTTIIQPPTHLATPGSKNSRCTYANTSIDTGNAGYQGTTHEDGFFHDDWLKEKHYDFTLPKPAQPLGVRPMFSKHHAEWTVNLRFHNHQPWCSLFLSSTAKDPLDITDRTNSVDIHGRYFYWMYEIPPSAPDYVDRTMARDFVVDALYLSQDFGMDPNEIGACLIQSAPASIRGKYHYGSSHISTDLVQTVSLYRAMAEVDEPLSATQGGFVFKIDSGDEWAYRCFGQTLPDFTKTIQAYYPPKTEPDRSIVRQLWWHWNKLHPADKIPPFPATVFRVAQKFIGYNVRGGPLRTNGTKPLWTSLPEQIFHETTAQSPYNGCGDWESQHISELSDCQMLGGSVNAGFVYYAGANAFRLAITPPDLAAIGANYLISFGTDRLYISTLFSYTDPTIEFKLGPNGKPGYYFSNGQPATLPPPP